MVVLVDGRAIFQVSTGKSLLVKDGHSFLLKTFLLLCMAEMCTDTLRRPESSPPIIR